MARAIGVTVSERMVTGLVVDHKLVGELRHYPENSDEEDGLVELHTDALVEKICDQVVAVAGAEKDLVGVGIALPGLIKDGVVNALTYPRAAAAEFGVPAAVPGDNLLLTCLWYIREVDPATLLVTGLTRDGVYLVEDGKVTGEVNNFRFNESPLDLLRRVTEVGATERTLAREWKDWFTRTAVGPMRIPDFHMSSTSRAR